MEENLNENNENLMNNNENLINNNELSLVVWGTNLSAYALR